MLCHPSASIAVVFNAWRYEVSTVARATTEPSRTKWSGQDEPYDSLAQANLDFQETNIAINRGKRNNGMGPDNTSNEHLLMMQQDSRQHVHEAFDVLFTTSSEPPEWQQRHVIAASKPSTKEPYELHQQRLLPLLSHFGGAHCSRSAPLAERAARGARCSRITLPTEHTAHGAHSSRSTMLTEHAARKAHSI